MPSPCAVAGPRKSARRAAFGDDAISLWDLAEKTESSKADLKILWRAITLAGSGAWEPLQEQLLASAGDVDRQAGLLTALTQAPAAVLDALGRHERTLELLSGMLQVSMAYALHRLTCCVMSGGLGDTTCVLCV